MTDTLKQSIQEQVSKLPKEIQDAINSFDWVKSTEEMGATYSLDEEQLSNFQAETALVLTGLVDPQFYAINIENHVETTKEQSERISDEASQRIFIPIRNILDENIKKNLKDKNVDWRQNVDFVLSGGDYSHFLSKNSPLEGN